MIDLKWTPFIEYPEGIDAAFVAQVNDFIEQYRPALKKLAK